MVVSSPRSIVTDKESTERANLRLILTEVSVVASILLAFGSAVYLLGLWVIARTELTYGIALLRPDWLLPYESWFILALTVFQFLISARFCLRLWRRMTTNMRNSVSH